jgi:polyhydroxybutyrate depolymerase
LTPAEVAARDAIDSAMAGGDPEGERVALERGVAQLQARKLEVPEPLERRTIVVGEKEREYFLYVPESARGKPAPVVFGLHGGSANSGLSQHFKSDYTGLAEKEGFVVVYPSGIRGWNFNPGGVSGRGGQRKDWDDLGFFDAMFQQLIDERIADPKRIYITGGSGGGLMTWSLMHHRGDRIAAVGILVATLPRSHRDWPPMKRPIPAIVMLGTLDPLITWDGRDEHELNVHSAPETLNYLLGRNGCSGEPAVGALTDRDTTDGVQVETATWSQCKAPIVLYRMNGHAHGWPMVENNETGPKTKDFVPIEAFWAFLEKYSL